MIDLTVAIKIPKGLRRQQYKRLVENNFGCGFVSIFQMYKGGVLRRVFASELNINNHYSFMEVLREHELVKEIYLHNIDFVNMAGWQVRYPNHRITRRYYDYYGTRYYEEDNWYRVSKCGITVTSLSMLDQSKCEKIDGKSLKYFWKKAIDQDCCESEIIQMIRNYRKNSLIEMLIQAGYKNLASSKLLMKLTPSKQKEVVRLLQSNPPRDYCISDILYAMKNNISISNVYLHQECKKHKVDYKYMISINQTTIGRYLDYLRMCQTLNVNLDDDYWRYPKNFEEKHQDVMNKINAINLSKRKEEIQVINKKINSIVKKLFKKEHFEKGYQITFPKSMEEIQKQATTLNQCLITSQYHKKYADKEIVLVFIKKDDLPVATAEIKCKTKKIGQFYANELDRNNCQPSDEVKEIFTNWYEKVFINNQKTQEACA